MFKLLENELDMVYASLSYVCACIKNVETIADYILENDDKSKYTLETTKLTEDIALQSFTMGERIKTEQERITDIKKNIVELY